MSTLDQALAAEKKFDEDVAAAKARNATPIDMVLHCPKCHLQHIDRDEELRRNAEGDVMHGCEMCDGEDVCTCPGKTPRFWINRPHRSHLCKREDGGCGYIWRPADVPTNGVAAVKTRGKDDSPILGLDREAVNNRINSGSTV